jgi:arylsulfatase A
MKLIAVFSTILVVGFVQAMPAFAKTSKPNFVFILCDDLGYGDVRAFNPERGKIDTPNIDRLAADGMMFTDAHASSSVCTPSRYSILTGRYNWRSQLQSGVLGGMAVPLIAPDRMTVASYLQGQGYTTACIGKWHLGLGYGPQRFTSQLLDGPLQHGFDHFFGISASLDMPPFAWIENDRFPETPTATKRWQRSGPAAPSFEAVDVMPTLTKKAVEYIRRRGNEQDTPYFLYLSFTAPHTPIVPAPEWKGKSGLGDYGDFVMQTDAAVGEVLQAIDESGRRNNTIVYFTSDNGFAPAANPMQLEALGHFPSGPLRGYKSDIWEGGHRVPLIIRWPEVVAPSTTSSQLVGLIDLFATTAEILQQSLPETAAEDSVSLLPILKGRDKPVRESLVLHSIDGRFAIRKGNWKLSKCAGSGGWGMPRESQATSQNLPSTQLYDLASDLREEHNRQSEHLDLVAHLTSKLEESIAAGRTTPGPPLKNDVAVKVAKIPQKSANANRKSRSSRARGDDAASD